MPYSILTQPSRIDESGVPATRVPMPRNLVSKFARRGVATAAAAALLFAGAGGAQAQVASAKPVSPAHCTLLPGQAAVGAVENGHLMRVFTPITVTCDAARSGASVTVQYDLFLHDRWLRPEFPKPIVDRRFATGTSTFTLPTRAPIDSEPRTDAMGVTRTIHLDNEFDAPDLESVFHASVRYRVDAPGVDGTWSAWQNGWYAGVTE